MSADLSLSRPLKPPSDHSSELDEDRGDVRDAQEVAEDLFPIFTQLESTERGLTNGGTSQAVANVYASIHSTVAVGEWEEGLSEDIDEAAPQVSRSLRDAHHVQQSQYSTCAGSDLGDDQRINHSPDYDEAQDRARLNLNPSYSTEHLRSTEPSVVSPVTKQRLAHEVPWVQWWPHPSLPPATSWPRPGQTRLSYHSERYAAFIKAYVGFSDGEVEKATRRGRTICMIGVRKLQKQKVGTVVQAQRFFLRHSVLAVEGDAVFTELMQRAETLYAEEIKQLWEESGPEIHAARTSLNGCSSDVQIPCLFNSSTGLVYARNNHNPSGRIKRGPRKRTGSGDSSVALPSSLSSPESQPPNARCIGLHYGLPTESSCVETHKAPRSSTCHAEGPRGGNVSVAAPYHRQATLIAVVSTTPIENGEEVRVSLESYYRCLDESAWYGRHYTAFQRPRYPRRTEHEDSANPNPLLGELHTGLKEFKLWPNSLPYYHGVGQRHADHKPRAGFPFTLVDLAPAPELGEGELGVVAAAFVPYATCLLYTGPAVATRKVEKISYEVKPRLQKLLEGRSSTALPNQQSSGNAIAGLAKEEVTPHVKASAGSSQDASITQRASWIGSTAREDLSFVTDDTYALGLGKHGVCFGQGLTRYINHRYNLTRFGNVELCSVMLSVRSDFSVLTNSAKKSCTRSRKRRRGADIGVCCSKGESRNIARKGLAKTVKRWRGNAAASTPPAAAIARHVSVCDSKDTTPKVSTKTLGGSGAASGVNDAKRQRRRCRNVARSIFLEEHSHFVTLPFFITTTDIEPGTPLLAWTYGEDYDAKLERMAVADGALVPYADAALLNARPIMGTKEALQNSQQRCWQRYAGDYRYAIGMGDVVWRRRPSRLWGPFNRSGAQVCCPPPEDDLFVVVDVMRRSTERVLVAPLRRRGMPDTKLQKILVHHKLDRYVSPAVGTSQIIRGTSSKGRAEDLVKPEVVLPEHEDQDEDKDQDLVEPMLGGRLHAFRQRSSSRTPIGCPYPSRSLCRDASPVAGAYSNLPNVSLSALTIPGGARGLRGISLHDVWAIFATDIPVSHGQSRAFATWGPNEWSRCWIATTDSLALLLNGIDYCMLDAVTEDGTSQVDPSVAPNSILVNLDDLHDTTRLVRDSARSCVVPVLLNGVWWSLIRNLPTLSPTRLHD